MGLEISMLPFKCAVGEIEWLGFLRSNLGMKEPEISQIFEKPPSHFSATSEAEVGK